MNYGIIIDDMRDILSYELDWKRFNNSKILITGANGFLPAYIAETLLYLNHTTDVSLEVYALVRNKEKAEKRFERYLSDSSFKLLVQDVCEPLQADINFNYIIHAASQASPKYYRKDPVGTLKPNVIGTYNLLEYARTHSVNKFVYFSSGEVYGSVEKYPISEKDYGIVDPTSLRSCYAESKRMGENICISYHSQYAIPTLVVRPFHTYGPGMDMDDGRVFADFVKNIVSNQNIVMNSDGSDVRSFLYLADFVKGFFNVMLNGIDGEEYNIGSDVPVTISELADTLIELFPENNLCVIKNLPDNSYYKSTFSIAYPNIEKIIKLGLKPNVKLTDGFLKTVNYYK